MKTHNYECMLRVTCTSCGNEEEFVFQSDSVDEALDYAAAIVDGAYVILDISSTVKMEADVIYVDVDGMCQSCVLEYQAIANGDEL